MDQPTWKELTSLAEAREFADTVGYPVLIRPSYVLSGAAMNVAFDAASLDHYLGIAADVSQEHPVVITKFYLGAQEIDVDAVAYQGNVLVHAISEHIEEAGVHSGDATLVLPSRDLSSETQEKVLQIARKVANALQITGPFNMQVIRQVDPVKGEQLKVIECNLRASRSFPFSSKVLGVNFIDVATRAIMNKEVPSPINLMSLDYPYQAVKASQFSWTRLQGADPMLGVEMASTGEVACFGKDKYQAYLAAILSTNGFKLPQNGILLTRDHRTDEQDFLFVAKTLQDLEFNLWTDTENTTSWLHQNGISCKSLPILPFEDKRALRAIFLDSSIDFVISLARERPSSAQDPGYLMRRAAVDFGIPLVNDGKCARLFVEALRRKRLDEREGIPEEVKSWREFVSEQPPHNS